MPLLFSFLLPFLTWLSTFAQPAPDTPNWIKQAGAKTAPTSKTTFPVAKYQAVGDGKTLNTKAIQAAIDAAAKKGGTVTFAPGQYVTGSLFLKKGVTLQLDRGVTILGSENIKDYPEIQTRVAGIEMKWPAALLNILDQDNVAITGQGLVDAQGKVFWDAYWALRKEYEAKGLRWIVDYDAKRPRTLLVSNSSNVTLTGITLQRAGFWTVHILYSKNVTADGLTIRNNIGGHGPSTDGIDIDSSSYVLVQNCDIDCNDDNFCLKSGRDWDGLRVNRPTEYIVIRDCVAGAGAGLVTCGSETSGGIRHVFAHNLKAKGTAAGLRIKSALTRGGTVEDIAFEDVQMDGVGAAVEVEMNWNPSYSYSTLPAGYSLATAPPYWKTMLMKVEPEKGLPHYRNVRVARLQVQNAKVAIRAAGIQTSLLENFVLEDLNITAAKAGGIEYAKGWTVQNLTIKSADQAPMAVQNSTDMKL